MPFEIPYPTFYEFFQADVITFDCATSNKESKEDFTDKIQPHVIRSYKAGEIIFVLTRPV